MKANGEPVYLILVYSVQTRKFQSILQCDQEVTQMCTSGSVDTLIVATALGSLMLYDFKNIIDGNPAKNDALTYDALLLSQVKDWSTMDADKKQHYYN